MKVGIPERLTSLSLGTSTARRLSHYAGVPTWWGAEQFFLTAASLASWASSSFDAICAGMVSAGNCGDICLRVCKLAWHSEPPSEWTVYSRWRHSTSEADSCSPCAQCLWRLARRGGSPPTQTTAPRTELKQTGRY